VTRQKILAGILLLALAACGDGAPAPPPKPPAPGISMDPSLWDIDWSAGTPAHPTANSGGGWYVDIPAAGAPCDADTNSSCPHLNMVVANPGKALSGTLSADASLATTGNPVIHFDIHSKQGCANPSGRPIAALYFQQQGDDFSGQGKFEFYRWWSKTTLYLDVAGPQAIDIPLQPSFWFSVFGRDGAANPTAFATALALPQAIGITFGGLCGSHHGVNVVGGTARFVVRKYAIQ
jgi:hypothetical protein